MPLPYITETQAINLFKQWLKEEKEKSKETKKSSESSESVEN